MAEPGRVIFLNGISSAGKTSIANALQDSLRETYVRTGVDVYLGSVPARMHEHTTEPDPPPHDGFQWLLDGDGRLRELRLGAGAVRLLAGSYAAAAALARSGVNLVIDDVIFDPRVFRAAVEHIHPLPVMFVGVRCPLDVAERREQERGDRTVGLARWQFDRVHAHGRYDLEVDTADLTPTECAARIAERLGGGPAPDALARAWRTLAAEDAREGTGRP